MATGKTAKVRRSEGFFSKSNLHTAGWAVLFGGAGYLFSFFDPFGNRPQEVVVKNIDSFPTSAGSTVVTLDGKAQADMARLREALYATQEALRGAKSAKAKPVDSPVAAPSADAEVARQLRDTQQALQEAIKLASPLNHGSIEGASSATISLLVPKATEAPELPPDKKGYTLEAPKGLKGIRCPTYHASSRRLRFAFDADAAVLARASPFRVTVASIQAPLKQTHMFGEYFRGQTGSNEVELDFDVPAGSYDVTIGYFDLRKISGEFPPFYGISCTVQV